ncbi:hypothetical protein C8F04DRAFT_953853 [Mycena alexandri]|uniref:Uncharacterized protein n=1 Tax=Mycena alexandri TaxID=1745969 RepID=A0AAD6SZD0_9AGAR|nr:hypothetical protein C8F04DRAFT_953853 [Mycena alexandri]
MVINAVPDSNNYAVAFPSSGAHQVAATPRPRPPHLPFRRISLPSNINPRHRESVVSVASFESVAEEPPVMQQRNKRVRARPSTADPREVKRRNVIQEFYETERAYVDGLELIYDHFLTPIISSLDTPTPLLARADLASVFSNFVDIWNLHRAFYASLSALLCSEDSDPPPLSGVLLAHFPYLSLYNPFVTSFPATIAAIASLTTPPSPASPNPHYSPAFAAYLREREADARCGKLRLRDWLLTIVQRCPRYLLLLKDLIACTPPPASHNPNAEHTLLTAAHALVARITLTLNTSIHTHAQTLSLLALQRATPSLPFQLIVPGRSLVRRGALVHVPQEGNGGGARREREFLLFGDCLVWLEKEGAGAAGTPGTPTTPSGWGAARPPMTRTRSKSEAELPTASALRPPAPTRTASALPPAARPKRPPARPSRTAHSGQGGRWVYKGRAELVDLEVVVPVARGEEGRRFEVLSPEGSFVVYADSEEERDAWTSAIRQTKAALFVSLNATHPDSTLTSSASTAHLRRALQALPFPPLSTTGRGGGGGRGKKHAGHEHERERRGRVEHWVPAIWIPDEKTAGCMRCGRAFGWRRRRHHCRLCGRCVCAGCSERTFFIADPNARDDAGRPARACNACYETVFPLLDPAPAPEDDHDGEGEGTGGSTGSMLAAHSNTMSSLANFPSWLSMPSLPLASAPAHAPDALMALDSPGARAQRQTGAKYERLRGEHAAWHGHGHHAQEGSHVEMAGERVRVRSPPPRPRSYHQILEDFEEARTGGITGGVPEDAHEDADADEDEERPQSGVVVQFELPGRGRRHEDTARRNKRFSLPAVAVQTTSVTARTQQVGVAEERRHAGRAKRFSLVLGHSGNNAHSHLQKPHGHAGKTRSEVGGRSGEGGEGNGGAGGGELGKGVAAGRLSELLGRHRPNRTTHA